jgi:hypothetical protein
MQCLRMPDIRMQKAPPPRKIPTKPTQARSSLVFVMGAAGGAFFICFSLIALASYTSIFSFSYNRADAEMATSTLTKGAEAQKPALPPLDKEAYDRKLLALANNPRPATSTRPTTATSTASTTVKKTPWPVLSAPYPNAGALLPFYRIIAYYGNFYSKGMGVLGQYPREEMIKKLRGEVAKWNEADPTTPVMPAIDYIAVTAQGSAGKDGKYRLRMPDSQVDYALELAKEVNGIVILDVQVGLSTLPQELPQLEKYFKMPNVHLAIDPEFSMKSGDKPGTVIGTFNANDVNYAANYLAKLVKENNLPPKILIVHRFTGPMVTRYKEITPLPEVQIVMDMDGWGSPAKKLDTYYGFIAPQPVQFTGFKLFYKNDLKPPSTRLLTPAELLKLNPIPSFIQFQ